MTLTFRELWTALHGMFLGAGFLLAFTGSAASLWCMRSEWTTPAGRVAGGRCLLAGAWTMALLAWLTVSLGTFVIYPWYRAVPLSGITLSTPSSLAEYPKALLISNPQTADWHEFAMEWKEHIGWLAPILATAVAVVATRYRSTLAGQAQIRRAMLMMLSASFFCAAVAGLFGALINKMAPVR
jgi:hypothetical protein